MTLGFSIIPYAATVSPYRNDVLCERSVTSILPSAGCHSLLSCMLLTSIVYLTERSHLSGAETIVPRIAFFSLPTSDSMESGVVM